MNGRQVIPASIAVLALVVALGFALVISIATGRPVIDRGTQLTKYLFSSKPPLSQKLADQLNETARVSLLDQLPPEMADRLVFEEVPSWNPLPMDDPATRMETLREVADSVPEPGRDWQELQGGIRDGYLLFLGALADYSRKHASLLDQSEKQLGEIQHKRGDAMRKLKKSTERTYTQTNGFLGRRVEETVLAWFTSPPDSKILGSAINDAYLTLTPNPQDSFSQYPMLTAPTSGDLVHWFGSGETSQQKPIGTIAASTAFLTGSPSPSVLGQAVPSDPKPTGQVVAKLYARDWQLFRLRRGWLNEALLEQYHRDKAFLLDLGWLFSDDGPLARIPIAIVIARDVLYRVQFTNKDDYSVAQGALRDGKPLQLSIGGTTLIVEPGSAKASDVDHTLTIAPARTRAQIVTVISLRY